MGFMGMDHVGESDMAADLAHAAADAVSKILSKDLPHNHGMWNTSGAVNIALFFEATVIPSKDYCFKFNDELVALAQKCLVKLQREKVAHSSHPREYARMIKNLTKYINEAEL